MPTVPSEKTTYLVTVTDTFGGDLNYSWAVRYSVNATSPLRAISKVKRDRYHAPVPRHRIDCSHEDFTRVDLVGSAVAITAEWCDGDPADLYSGVKSLSD